MDDTRSDSDVRPDVGGVVPPGQGPVGELVGHRHPSEVFDEEGDLPVD